MSFSEKMKRARLEFYEEDVQDINQVLDEFMNAAQPKCVLMIDKEGHLITKKGFTQTINTDNLAALVAGSFAATREVAKLLGETEFSVLFHQGVSENIHVSLVGERALVVIVFDNRTTLGMVRVTAEQLATKLGKVLEEAAERNKDRAPAALNPAFETSAQEALDDFFKE
jgi:predicted regulator of Ras-like GTPase activity (Roadblock/LC7/MglB family)